MVELTNSHHLGTKFFSKSWYGKIEEVKYFHEGKKRPFVIRLPQISVRFKRNWQSPVVAKPRTVNRMR